MKPKFIIGTGFGWSATTPLFYTLTITNEFMSPGLAKEDNYLKNFEKKVYKPGSLFRERANKKQGIRTQREKYKRKKLEYTNKLNHKNRSTGGLKPESVKHRYFTQEEVDEYYSPPYTIEKYITYYRKHWEYLQEHGAPHHAVCDFSNINGSLSKECIDKVVSALSEHFEVKVLCIVRDPIRRQWSESCSISNPKARALWESPEQHLDYYFQSLLTLNRDYLEQYDRWSSFAPYHMVVMEQLWEGDQQEREVSRLSDFIEFDIQELHSNVYSPDCGTNPPYIPGLVDQWTSDNFQLKDHIYYKSIPYFQSQYDAWEQRFGSLPLYWGKPYPYPVEQPEIAKRGLMKGYTPQESYYEI